ncbi:hypothetical protein [Alkalitalea saponilacus]|uniref:Outer membrane protein beta-barrel domain-containing protein n=1 Tax=Alkalitalea saponilacus TaxID=889453 RepID=A0A1T5AHK8_9BACT|nr:hypothetical protein [Alkalitalea saponilacus]ASB48700.1 hypothetical protein CDL62_05855 [Alkalitalea saponilacus]SKB34370.1 hypothetical protein SAMN03080601_00267 [Alkalitalea saponilacus]
MNSFKLGFFLLFISITSLIKSQNSEVESSLWGFQAGILPLAIYNETKLSNQIALRSELMFAFAFDPYINAPNGSFGWALIPKISVEPRYYYNLRKRQAKLRRIDGNSGNFLSINLGYGTQFAFSNTDIKAYPTSRVIPMYGLRRNIGKRFNYEFAVGLGPTWVHKNRFYYNFEKEEFIERPFTEKVITPTMRLALGYKYIR